MWWDYILSFCSNHRMFPGKTNPKQTGQKQRCWQLRPTKQENTSKEITADVLNWVQWKKDTTHLCDPETLGCWSSFSAWVKAMTLSPRAKATKALQARMEHLDMRVQLPIDSSLEARAERRQVCWRERRIKKRWDRIPQVTYLRFSISCFLRGDDGAADRILSASCHFPLRWKKTIGTDYLVHRFILKLACTKAL